MTPWPYPRWIAHRGGGTLAPENTLAAFKVGAAHGYRMFECDVKLSADGVPFLLHDDTLNRTTNGQGTASAQTWAALSALDAGGWHSPAFAGEKVPCLEAIADYCLANGLLLNIEIKPAPGAQAVTGTVLANAVAAWWKDAAVPPLLTSFHPLALAAAQRAQPQLPRGLLLDTWLANSVRAAQALACTAMVCRHTLWSATRVAQARSAGLKTLSYTVNDLASVQRLGALGTDGIITDQIGSFPPRS